MIQRGTMIFPGTRNLYAPLETLRHPGARIVAHNDCLVRRYAVSVADSRRMMFVSFGAGETRAQMAAELIVVRKELRA